LFLAIPGAVFVVPHIAENPARVREMDHRSGVKRRMTVRGPILMS